MKDYYESLYRENTSYWGMLPSPLSLFAFQQVRSGTVLDLGCGQGPDALFFAKKGLRVMAIDISPTAIADLRRQAEECKLVIDTHESDMNDLPSGEFTLIFSRMALQMIPPDQRTKYIARLKRTYPGAVHAHVVPISGACFGTEFIVDDTLLKDAYSDWDILFYEEAWTISRVMNRSGEPYLMREARIIARKQL